MTSCPDCTEARIRTWGGYTQSCLGCIARSAARSLDAWHALHEKGSGDKEALREQIARRMPGCAYSEARRMVFDWWQHDQGVTR